MTGFSHDCATSDPALHVVRQTTSPIPLDDRGTPHGTRSGNGDQVANRQLLDTQAGALRAAGVTRIFAEKISTRALTRPELDKAVALAREIRASGAAVTIVVHEHKRLGRGIELAALAEQLRADGIALEFLTGELQGSHDPSGDPRSYVQLPCPG